MHNEQKKETLNRKQSKELKRKETDELKKQKYERIKLADQIQHHPEKDVYSEAKDYLQSHDAINQKSLNSTPFYPKAESKDRQRQEGEVVGSQQFSGFTTQNILQYNVNIFQ